MDKEEALIQRRRYPLSVDHYEESNLGPKRSVMDLGFVK
jgi:hypothetical protein